jgi:hypothetical protein
MKKIFILLVVVAVAFAGCKDDDEDVPIYNLLTVTSGTHNGFTYQFNDVKGEWGQVNQTTRSYSLGWGDVILPPTVNYNYGYAFFYYDGSNSIITFPSPEGQQLNFAFDLQNDGTACTLQYQDATIIINEVTDTEIKGTVSGQFINSCDGETISLEMEFSLALEEV